MRRAKLKKVYGADCHRWRFKGHASLVNGPPSEVDISVTEKDDGTIIVELERSEGKVTLIAGKIVLTLNEGNHFKEVDRG